MKAFQKFEPKKGVVCYSLVFEKGEYVAVFRKPGRSGVPNYERMQYRKREEEDFSIVDERVWALAISQALTLIEALDELEIDPDGASFNAD
jgi:hypothetical protein